MAALLTLAALALAGPAAWAETVTYTISGITGTDKTSRGIAVQDVLLIEAASSTGGYITLIHESKRIYHVVLKDDRGNVVHEMGNRVGDAGSIGNAVSGTVTSTAAGAVIMESWLRSDWSPLASGSVSNLPFIRVTPTILTTNTSFLLEHRLSS